MEFIVQIYCNVKSFFQKKKKKIELRAELSAWSHKTPYIYSNPLYFVC